ncbi:MAG: hypothetical protein ACFHVJ_07765 [Aestuariibacter sp.]
MKFTLTDEIQGAHFKILNARSMFHVVCSQIKQSESNYFSLLKPAIYCLEKDFESLSCMLEHLYNVQQLPPTDIDINLVYQAKRALTCIEDLYYKEIFDQLPHEKMLIDPFDIHLSQALMGIWQLIYSARKEYLAMMPDEAKEAA